MARAKKDPYWYTLSSWRNIVQFELNGHTYEVIFGYGIDPSEKVWGSIKDEHYEFTDLERQIIDSWFKEETDGAIT